ncbi:MAG: PAS domain S-box protein [Burkholderiales bacterium]|nr:PAS domain S-box protein [Burkholderiales bacterium]
MSTAPSSTYPAPAPATGRRWRRLALMLLLVLALPLLGALSPQYEVAGALIAPLAPALALALAATARLGWRVLPAVALGAMLAACGWPLAEPGAAQWLDALVLLAQTAFGGLLMRRSGRPDDLALDSPPAIRRLVAVALACAMLGALSELLADLVLPTVSITRPLVVALLRATADAGSVLLLVPLILAFSTPQRLRWQARRRSVALPLGVSVLLLLAALAGIDARDREHAQAAFERDADVVFARTQGLLDAPLQALQALHGTMQTTSVALSPTQFDALARPWVERTTGLAEIGWLDAPRPDGSGATLHHSLTALPAGAPPAAPAAPATAAADIGPTALLLRPTLAKAMAQASPMVSPVVGLNESQGRTGIVIFQSLAAEPGTALHRVVFASVLVDRLLTPLLASRTDAMYACLFDQDARVERRRLYGAPGCETAATGENRFSREVEFDFAGRRWAMRVSQQVRTHGGVWLFALPALAGGALLSVLLLTLTGRVQRIEAEARQRTGEMQREIELLRGLQQRHEHALDAVLDTVQTGVALVEPDGRVQRANTAFGELLGSAAAELRRRPIDELLQDDDHPLPGRILGLINEVGHELVHHSLRLRLADGRVLPVLLTLRVLRDRDGRVHAAVCALHDLSENLRRRQAERVLGDVLELARTEPEPGAATALPRNTVPGALDQPVRMLCILGEQDRGTLLGEVFAQRPHLRPSHADSADHGLMLAASDAPHLVLLDLRLPGADGLAVLQQLAGDPRTREIPVIVLSDDPRPDRIDAAFSAGARAYLSQPLDVRQLLAAIDELV